MRYSKAYWNKLSGKYDRHVMGEYAKAYGDTVELTRKYLKGGDLVLDYGCGTGITTTALARHVKKIVALDISDGMIAAAKAKAEKQGIRNIEFSNDDLFSAGIAEGSFDVVTAFNLLHFLPDLEAALKRLHALLKPAGLFISVTDCLGESPGLVSALQSLPGKIGLRPRSIKFKTTVLEKTVQSGHFTILETANLYASPPNYFIAARKS